MKGDRFEGSVLIVGGGPFGLMLSLELSRRGICSVLVDAAPGTTVNPQANATQARTMEHFRRLGFASEVRALGLPKDYPTDIAYFTRYSRQELARFQLPSSAHAADLVRAMEGSWSAAELPHRVSQMFVEELLRRHAEASSLASVNYGWRLTQFRQGDASVEARIESVATGEARLLKARYLIGADGARSTVRRALGIRYRGETGVQRDFLGGKMVALHIRAPDFYRVVPHPRAWMYVAFNTARRSWLAAVNGKDEFAFHTQLKPGEDEAVEPALARLLFEQVVGTSLDFEILNVDTWTAGHALVAERFIDQSVILGGDAAHLFTPAGGLGYNTAIEDAVNLGWKLAAMLDGQAGQVLIDSYEYERHRLATRNTGYARALADSIGNFLPSPFLEEHGEAGERARSEASEYLNAHARREFNIPGITFGGRYDGSPVIIDDGSTPPEDLPNSYMQSATPGGRAPHLWLEDGRSIFDLLGFGWTLLVLADRAEDCRAFAAAARDRGVDLTIVRLESAAARSLYLTDLALIRPDQIVAWRHVGAYHPHAVLRQVLGHGRDIPGSA